MTVKTEATAVLRCVTALFLSVTWLLLLFYFPWVLIFVKKFSGTSSFQEPFVPRDRVCRSRLSWCRRWGCERTSHGHLHYFCIGVNFVVLKQRLTWLSRIMQIESRERLILLDFMAQFSFRLSEVYFWRLLRQYRQDAASWSQVIMGSNSRAWLRLILLLSGRAVMLALMLDSLLILKVSKW